MVVDQREIQADRKWILNWNVYTVSNMRSLMQQTIGCLPSYRICSVQIYQLEHYLYSTLRGPKTLSIG